MCFSITKNCNWQNQLTDFASVDDVDVDAVSLPVDAFSGDPITNESQNLSSAEEDVLLEFLLSFGKGC